ncbi:hypothetical protein NST02_17935 [Robertmurraya sp. FSL W8-0741]|uniref:hypothetical protein n=1 Tax=Robertmurraya sp. FSL W8-0741 TaxID=2954629 RepID=UPI0030FB7AA7
MSKKNPLLKKKFDEGYQAGFLTGTKNGYEQGKYSATMYFASRFEGLQDVKGIGPKTMEIIVNHFGAEYFKKVNE